MGKCHECGYSHVCIVEIHVERPTSGFGACKECGTVNYYRDDTTGKSDDAESVSTG